MNDIPTEAEALREVVREAHGAIKDLTRIIKETNTARVALEEAVAREFNTRIEPYVEAGLADYHENLSIAISDATDSVYERFDQIAEILLGETRKDDETLADMARRIRDKRRGVL